MKKLSLSLLLALALALCAVALAESGEFEFNAQSGKITGYTGPGGEVVIPAEIDGTRVWDVDYSAFRDNEAVTSITFPEGMDVMNDNVTSQIPNLTHVTLPDSLRVICRGNFQLCNSLTKVTLPAGVSYISDNCFSWCEQLTSITFTGLCPQIADYSFSILGEGCVVYVPDDQLDAYRAALPSDVNVQGSGKDAVVVEHSTPEDQFDFDPQTGTITGYRDRLARMDIPAQIGGVAVKAIGKKAFTPAYHLMYLTVPEGVEVIDESAFANTNSILYVSLPDSLREIGDEAFLSAIRGSRFQWPKGLETIGSRAFSNCYFTDDIVLPATLKSIGEKAFETAWPKNLILPEGCKPYIGSHALDRCAVTYIQMDSYNFFEMAPDAFEDSRISSVDLPWDSDWDNRLAWQAYFDAQGLEDCQVWINNPPDCTYEDGAQYEIGPDGYFYMVSYTGEQEAPYAYYNVWDNSGDQSVLVPCYGLGDGVFKDNQAIRRYRVTHANHPWHIGDEAFANSSVELVDLFYTTETIGEGAFRNCANLTEITLPASLKSIGAGAFDGCDNLARVTVLCDPDILPEDAFGNCAALMADPTGLILPAGASDESVARLSAEMGRPWYAPLTRVGEAPRTIVPMPFEPTDPAAFEFNAETGTIIGYLGNEADVVVPREIDGVPVTSIGYNAFEGCRDYTDTDMASNRARWTRLRSVVLPETVTAIADSAFSYCQQLESLICYGPVESTGRSTFQLCRALRNAVFVNGTRIIDNYCFDHTESFEFFYSATPLDKIGDSAFVGSGLTAFAADARQLGNGAFSNCPNLSELHLSGRVEATDGSVANNCPALSLVCFEGDSMDAYSRDGCVAGCAGALTVRVPEDADEEMKDRAGRCVLWGTQSTVTVEAVACDRAEAELPDIEALLAEYAANPVIQPEPEAEPEPVRAEPVGEAGAPYLGAWSISEVTMGGTTYAAADLGMNGSFDLHADGTVDVVDVDGTARASAWSVTEKGVFVDGMELIPDDEGRLVAQMEGGELVLARIEAASEPEPEAEPEPEHVPTAEPIPAPSGEELPFTEVKLFCVGAETSGYAVDPNALGGEYSVLFHADGTLELVIADAALTDLSWTPEGDERLVDYYGQGVLRFVPTDEGYTMNFLDAMTLTFE